MTADPLAQLAAALETAGWATVVRDGTPRWLIVRDPARPGVGESVRVGTGPGGRPHWWTPLGVLAPCGDVAGAVNGLEEAMTRYAPLALRTVMLRVLAEDFRQLLAARAGGRAVVLARTRDDIYIGRTPAGRVLGSFYAEPDPGWWQGCLANGTGKRLWVPDGGAEEVARRLFVNLR